ncbi:MAG: flagellar hook protein FlgE [Chloroflexi bacterium]|nr:flagellar hook protein FlgE [Chloroflexota bacterium]
MLRSMSVAISALRNHQVYMDVVAGNIANVNTTGYKASRISFQELLSQTLRGSSAPRGGSGGLNPIQIGLGVALGGIDTMFNQGSLQDTGRLTDLAIQGDGFFVLNSSSGFVYSRDGVLDIGLDGSLVNVATGMKVQGWMADTAGAVDTSTEPTDITIPFGQSMARASAKVGFQGNLSAEAVAGDAVNTTIGIYDSQGTRHTITLTFTRSPASNEWTWAASTSDSSISNITPAGTTVDFDSNGQYDVTNNPATTISIAYNNGADSPSVVNLDFSALTQLAGSGSVAPTDQDGLPPGTLTTFAVSTTGEVSASFSNGLTRRVGQLALARFLNAGGLKKVGQSLFAASANSGTPQIGLPQSGGRGHISSGYLEMSNVELAREFTNMIAAQRGFQANSRVITTSDELLQELVNLKR